jgi:hypothetical protein
MRNLNLLDLGFLAPKTASFPSGLILYVDPSNIASYPGSGSTWNDLSGVGNNLTWNNVPVQTGDEFILTGIHRAFRVAALAGIALPCTFIGLTKATGSPLIQALVDCTTSGGAPFGLTLTRNNSDPQFYRYMGTDNGVILRSANTWYMSTVILRSDRVVGYVNTTPDVNAADSNVVPGGNFTFGGNVGGSTDNWIGSVGVAQVYNRELSLDEITTVYNVLKPRYGLP